MPKKERNRFFLVKYLKDKKVVEKPQEDVTLDLKNKTIYEELEIYLNHIKVADVTTVLDEFKSLDLRL